MRPRQRISISMVCMVPKNASFSFCGIRRQKIPCLWPHDNKNSLTRGIHSKGVCIIRHVPGDQCRSRRTVAAGVTTRNSSDDSRHGDVSLNSARLEELGIDDFARFNGDIICRDTLQHGFGIAAYDTDLPKLDISNMPTRSRTARCSLA